MLHLLSALYSFVRLGPITLGAVAVAVLGLGYFLQVAQNDRLADEAAALAAGPPAAVDVAKFDRDRDATDLREVVLRGQAVFDFAYELTIEKDSGDVEGFMVPLVSETATSEKEVVAIAFFHERGFRHEQLTPEFLMNGLVGFGNIGPIMEYNGKLSSLGTWDDLTREAFGEIGLAFSDDLVVVWPFIDGREVAYAPPAAGDMTMFGLFSKIAGAIGLLALAKLVFSNKPEDTPDAPAVEPEALAPAHDVAPKASAVPLWKQRSGLVDESEYAPDVASFEPAHVDTPQLDDEPVKTRRARPSRSGFGLRKILICIVGALFVLGLAATISDLIAKSAPAEVVQVQSVEEGFAEGVAAAVVPDADPDRHWTDIDVTPVAEWFVAKFLLAASGDVNAQIILGSMIGGLIVALFLLRMFFAMRRTFQPKTTARFDSMGIN